jgi:hypothetical protein
MSESSGAAPSRHRAGLFRSPLDAAAGAFLLFLAAVALHQIRGLDLGTLRSFGPAMLPRALAFILGASGLVLIVMSLTRKEGSVLERWSIRGPFFIIGSILAFAFTIRVFGLAVAGPLAMIIGAHADREVRLKETLIFSAVLTAVCILLFRYVLGLPIPILKTP